ncbi:MAG: DUF2804 domain-containing protein [Treponema sp.]|jgi:hypothetical protein|nr:DUF2804 domain-containing protein [Treponema sp.]
MAPLEIETPVPVLDEAGYPGNFGWARSPLFSYNPMLIRAARRRVSESDRYIVFSPTHLIIIEILDNGYLGYVGMSVVSLKDKNRSTQTFITPFPLGSFELSPDSTTGSVRVQRKKASFNFAVMEKGVRIIKVDIPNFAHRRNLRGAVVLSSLPEAESLVTLMPWRREKNAFRYSRHSPWYIAEGVIQFGTQEIVFTNGNAWGIFDWNREVRPRSDIRYWAAGCGLSGSRHVGFSVGYGSVDSGQGTENAFFLDGKLHKLDQVTFQISPANWLTPWRFTSNDNRLEMVFTPHQERVEQNRFIFHSLRRRQVCGFFSGRVILDDRSVFEFQNITGFAERRKTRF